MSDRMKIGMQVLAKDDQLLGKVEEYLKTMPEHVLLDIAMLRLVFKPSDMERLGRDLPEVCYAGLMMFCVAATREHVNRGLAKEREGA